MPLPTRVLGRTGVPVSVLGVGGGALGFGNVTHEQGVAIVRRALEVGITYFDTAHHYGSEPILGDGLAGHRDEVFLVTKTIKRNRQMAWADIRLSLRQLKTDRVDLLIMHCVNTLGDLEAIVGPGGSLAAALEAQSEGLVRFVGISGHARPNILALALERHPFDVVFPALGALDALVTAPQHFLLPAAQRAGCGIVGMKVLGSGRLAPQAGLALRYTLGLGAHCAIVGFQSVAEVDSLASVAADPRPLSPEEEAALMSAARVHVVGRDDPPYWFNDAEVIAYKPGWIGARG